MPTFKNTEIEALRRRQIIFQSKIAEERAAMKMGTYGPGAPQECQTILGESRKDRLLRWENAEMVSVSSVPFYECVWR